MVYDQGDLMESKLKRLRTCLIGAGVCIVIGLILIIVAVVVLATSVSSGGYDSVATSPFISLAIEFVGIIVLLVGAVFEIIAAVTILSTDWNDKELNDKKILWGVLSLVLFPIIAPIIFYVSAKKKIPSQSQPEQVPVQ